MQVPSEEHHPYKTSPWSVCAPSGFAGLRQRAPEPVSTKPLHLGRFGGTISLGTLPLESTQDTKGRKKQLLTLVVNRNHLGGIFKLQELGSEGRPELGSVCALCF